MTETTSKAAVFIDTNIWLYALIVGQDVDKSKIARQLIAENNGNIIISSQVVIEVVANLSKKSQLEETELRQLISGFYQDHQVLHVGESIMHNASHLREQYSFSYWDSLIVAAALQANATVLYSEDMQAGLVIDQRLTIINPFTARP
jgi:predicted nucleic acid-binding protein